MKWSWKIGRIAGIDLYMHATFALLIGWLALSYWIASQSVSGALSGVAFILSLFACVVLHELGHALTAKRFGIQTRDITLLPIGGVARLERMPDDPKQELLVAIAGPAVNVVIAIVLYVYIAAASTWEPLERLTVATGPFVQRLLVANVWLVLFNLIPAFPMDGGRMLRALLATRMKYLRATQIAAALGQGIALLFGFIGLFSNPFLLFIALFVWIGAAEEAAATQMRVALSGIPVEAAMITDFHILSMNDTLARAVELILSGFQQDFPVMVDQRVVGVLTQPDLMVALTQNSQDHPVAAVMQRKFQTATPHEMLEGVLRRLQECECRTIPVLENGRLVGLVTPDNIGEFFMIQSALQKRRGYGSRIPQTPQEALHP
jgi:Zn-dependent protease/predicted transcriptional regulator